jgi:iron complex transport system substrate-binding protein
MPGTSVTLACVAASLALGAFGCGGDDEEGAATANSGTAEEEQQPAERTVDRCGEQVTIPGDPQRIFVSSSTFADILYALEEPVVGIGEPPASLEESYAYFRDHAKAKGTPYIGKPDYTQDLEKIAELAPDLIFQYLPDNTTKQLGQLAPVLHEPSFCKGRMKEDWVAHQDLTRYVAKAVGKEERAEQLITALDERIAADKAEIADEWAGTKVMIAEAFGGGGFGVDGGMRRQFDEIITGMGLEFIPRNKESVYDYSAEQMVRQLGMADYIVFASYEKAATDLDKLFDNPLWKRVPAVQDGNVCRVDLLVWGGAGIMAAEAMRQDLKECFTEEPVDGMVDAFETTQVRPEDLE